MAFMKNKFDFSLVLACYNEGSLFKTNIKKIFSVLDQTDFSYEIIFVEDKSIDKTAASIRQLSRITPAAT